MQRSFEVTEWHLRADDDGRTVTGRIVPYNEPANIVEKSETGLKEYREQFLPRSCMYMSQAIRRRGNGGFMGLLMDHEENDFHAKIGHCVDLEDRNDGAHATFRLYQSRDLDKVVSMLNESHRGLSVNFADRVPPKWIDGVLSRVQVVIDHVAATPSPCYAGAGITGIRSGEDMELGTPNLDEIRNWLNEYGKVAT